MTCLQHFKELFIFDDTWASSEHGPPKYGKRQLVCALGGASPTGHICEYGLWAPLSCRRHGKVVRWSSTVEVYPRFPEWRPDKAISIHNGQTSSRSTAAACKRLLGTFTFAFEAKLGLYWPKLVSLSVDDRSMNSRLHEPD